MRNCAFRRHQIDRHLWRHYDDLTCSCWTDPKEMARFKEQPKSCSRPGCGGNPRRAGNWTSGERSIQERRAGWDRQKLAMFGS